MLCLTCISALLFSWVCGCPPICEPLKQATGNKGASQRTTDSDPRLAIRCMYIGAISIKKAFQDDPNGADDGYLELHTIRHLCNYASQQG
ncbi:hypothetical protein M011DRAFT_472773 [Sporormia fimetaria CBS 119925]|uniref:Secreted protein n=1 Tax=Sporormia fimetaria CBS 119925 TaxID=1340428 RepID=A0A6A6UUM2_9PLEO|nr:hypothetical protein M011DRAFT_472773 [Sporormia fimetaria CBS 119925]